MDEHGSTGSPMNLMMAIAHITSNGEAKPPSKLTSSASFKARTKKPNPANAATGVISRAGSEVDDIITLLHGAGEGGMILLAYKLRGWVRKREEFWKKLKRWGRGEREKGLCFGVNFLKNFFHCVGVNFCFCSFAVLFGSFYVFHMFFNFLRKSCFESKFFFFICFFLTELGEVGNAY